MIIGTVLTGFKFLVLPDQRDRFLALATPTHRALSNVPGTRLMIGITKLAGTSEYAKCLVAFNQYSSCDSTFSPDKPATELIRDSDI